MTRLEQTKAAIQKLDVRVGQVHTSDLSALNSLAFASMTGLLEEIALSLAIIADNLNKGEETK